MAGTPTCIVSSGAIALGLGSLGRSVRPRRVAELQAAAAVGQGILQRAWERAVGRHGARAAQVLLTAADVRQRATYVNARSTLETLLAWDVIPVVNENDSTATDEITFGDNDALAAQVAVLTHARLLVLLTDQEGLFTRDPRRAGAELVREVNDHRLLDELEVGGSGSSWGSGGMRSKVVAAEMASAGGVATVIAHGATAGVVAAAIAGEQRRHAVPRRRAGGVLVQAVDPVRPADGRADRGRSGRPQGAGARRRIAAAGRRHGRDGAVHDGRRRRDRRPGRRGVRARPGRAAGGRGAAPGGTARRRARRAPRQPRAAALVTLKSEGAKRLHLWF